MSCPKQASQLVVEILTCLSVNPARNGSTLHALALVAKISLLSISAHSVPIHLGTCVVAEAFELTAELSRLCKLKTVPGLQAAHWPGRAMEEDNRIVHFQRDYRPVINARASLIQMPPNPRAMRLTMMQQSTMFRQTRATVTRDSVATRPKMRTTKQPLITSQLMRMEVTRSSTITKPKKMMCQLNISRQTTTVIISTNRCTKS